MKIRTAHFDLAVYAKGNKDSGKLALVLPGQLDTKDYPHMIGHVDFLSTKGFFALSFDPPGTWESPGDISIYNMTNYLEAINELIGYFGDRPTITVGHSRGGAMAMLAGLTNPLVEAFICIMSNYTYDPTINTNYDSRHGVNEWQEQGFKISYRDLPFDSKEKKEFRLPYSFIEDQRKYDMLNDLKKCTKPKLFIYGAKDKLVRPDMVKFEYKVSPEPKQLYELDSDHDYRRHPKLIEQVNNVMGDFIKRHNLL
jgi:pimeloyl-ACP methyl ester carboxylesterase